MLGLNNDILFFLLSNFWSHYFVWVTSYSWSVIPYFIHTGRKVFLKSGPDPYVEKHVQNNSSRISFNV